MIDNLILKEYKEIIKNNSFNLIPRIYCLYCVECSCQWLDIDLNTSDETKLEMSSVVHQYYLDTELQINKISDIICSKWDEYLKRDDFDITDYLDEF